MKNIAAMLDDLKHKMGPIPLAEKLGAGSTETLNRWIRDGLPKRKESDLVQKINKLYTRKMK